MNKEEFHHLRKKMRKTQVQMAQLLGTSVKAVHSYEQGWRRVPVHVERQVLFLATRLRQVGGSLKPCWKIKACPPERRNSCPAWEFQAGTLCWFINGTICEGSVRGNWQEKMAICRSCKVLLSLLDQKPRNPENTDPCD